MKEIGMFVSLGVFCAVGLIVYTQGVKQFRELLTGYEEVPSISTAGQGKFTTCISNDQTQMDYQLSYSGLEGDVQQAHIHLRQSGVSGGISVFHCTNLGNGSAGTQLCPPAPATITGTITTDDVSPNTAATAGARARYRRV